MLSAADRLQLSALADRLIFGDPDRFDRADALELAQLLPPSVRRALWRRLLPDIQARGQLPGKTSAGFAAGIGQVSLKEPGGSFSLDSRGRHVFRAGQWKFFRSGNSIEIEQVMADDTDVGRTARVDYRNDEPVRMCLLQRKEITIGFLCFGMAEFQPWKTPSEVDLS
jgi:hypothetical protein